MYGKYLPIDYFSSKRYIIYNFINNNKTKYNTISLYNYYVIKILLNYICN